MWCTTARSSTRCCRWSTGSSERLRSGADVADFGCGSGHAINVMARAFPASRFTGIDFSDEAIAVGARRGGSTSVWRTRPSRATTWRSSTSRDAYDVITVFDAIHDQAQPARVLENIYRALRPGGVLLMADIKASSRLEDNVGVPMSTYLYTTSLMHCMTVSLALDGAGLGAAWGTQLATSMLGRRRVSATCGWPRSSRTRSTTTTSPLRGQEVDGGPRRARSIGRSRPPPPR